MASAQVAKPSLSQMSFHHGGRDQIAEPLVRELVGDGLGLAAAGGGGGVLRIEQEEPVAERDQARVLHRARGEVGDGDDVELGVRVADAEVLAELAR